jgi:ABC-type multidrug transport system fused ATPase/permease subunit
MTLAGWTLSLLRPYRARVAAIVALSLLEIGLAALAPWPLKAVVDNVLGGSALPPIVAGPANALSGGSALGLLAVIVVAGLLLQLSSELVSMVHTQIQVDTAQRLVYDLRRSLLSHLQALSLRHHVATRTADGVYRLETDAYCINDLAIGGVFPLAMAVIKLGVMFAILLRLDLTLALLSLVVVPFLWMALRYYSRKMVDRAERVKALESSLVERMYEISRRSRWSRASRAKGTSWAASAPPATTRCARACASPGRSRSSRSW